MYIGSTDMKNLGGGHFPNDHITNEEGRKISPSSETGNGMRRLQDEINTLTKRNGGKFKCLEIISII